MHSFHFLLVICFINCLHGQKEEFSFGGAVGDDEDEQPDITFNGSSNETLIKSEMQLLYVSCNVTNFPEKTFSIKWTDSDGRVLSTNNILYVKSLLKSQEGKYNCTVENKKNPEQKYYKQLDLKITIPTLTIDILPDENLKIGGKIRRQCSDFDIPKETMVDDFTYTWLNQENKTIGFSNILEIPIVDNSIIGKYICLKKSKETLKVYEASTTVDLKMSTAYTLYIVTTPAAFKYGDKFSLTCNVEPSFPDIKYTWYKGSEILGNQQTLMFKKFGQEHTGKYKCAAVLMLPSGKLNLEAESTQQFAFFRANKIELTEKPGPEIIVHEGEKKELHCEIEVQSGSVGSDAAWFFNGKPLQQAKFKNVAQLDKKYVNLLVISDIKTANAGNYECHIGNKVKEVNIVVVAGDGIIETSPPILKIREGQAAEFHCRVENIPNVKNTNLQWKFVSKDGSLKYDIPNARWIVQNSEAAEQTSFIDLSNAEMIDNGFYICTEPNGRTSKSELIVTSERESGYITITPREIRVRSGQRIDIECFTKNIGGRAAGLPKFHFPENKPIGRDSRFVVSNVGASHIRLTAPVGLTLSDNNMTVECSSGDQKVFSKIYVKDICPPGYRYCQNGQCLENAKFCDKNVDCSDGSDEDPVSCKECDPVSKKCQVHEGASPRRGFILLQWICDGEDDCGNGFDEANCDESLTNCGGKYYKCSDGEVIPRSFVCDGTLDCRNSDDEMHCTSPEIINSTEVLIKAYKTQQVVMKCEAKGKPLPTIAWRFNWGCIKSASRFIVNSQIMDCNTITSTLIINNFQAGDDGIYNCEALSSRQRAFSNDFQVILQNN